MIPLEFYINPLSPLLGFWFRFKNYIIQRNVIDLFNEAFTYLQGAT